MDTWLQHSPIRSHLLLWMCLILIWGTSIHPGTITLDTEWLVLQNPILSVHSWDSWRKIWLDISVGTRLTLGAEYLPIRDLTVWFDWWVFGDSWGGHHLHSLLWYGISCSILWSINQQVFARTSIVWLGTLMFMMHPTHVESVVWLASRKDVVSLTFVLLSVRLYLARISTFWVGLTVLLAYWSKNTAIVLGPLLVLISICHHRESVRRLTWWTQWIPVAVPLVGGLWLTLQIGSSVAMFAEPRGSTPIETLNIASQTWLQYTSMLVYPESLSLFYAEPVLESWTHFGVLAGFMTGLLLVVSALLLFARNRRVTLALVTIPLGLLPVSQITPIQNLMADRYLLIPSVGFTWLIIQLVQYLQTKFSRAWVLYLFWGFALGAFTIERLKVFQQDVLLWTDVTVKQPEEIRGWTTLAALHRDNGDVEKSTEIIRSAEKYHPQHPKLTLAHGMNALREGNLQQAKNYFEAAWQIDTTLREAGNNYAWVLQKEDVPRSIEVAKEVTNIHPLYATGWDTLGNSCLLIQDWSCAKMGFERALDINPYRVDTHANLGSLFYLQEDWSQAAFWWTQTLTLKPSHTYAQQGLDSIHKITGDDNSIVP